MNDRRDGKSNPQSLFPLRILLKFKGFGMTEQKCIIIFISVLSSLICLPIAKETKSYGSKRRITWRKGIFPEDSNDDPGCYGVLIPFWLLCFYVDVIYDVCRYITVLVECDIERVQMTTVVGLIYVNLSFFFQLFIGLSK